MVTILLGKCEQVAQIASNEHPDAVFEHGHNLAMTVRMREQLRNKQCDQVRQNKYGTDFREVVDKRLPFLVRLETDVETAPDKNHAVDDPHDQYHFAGVALVKMLVRYLLFVVVGQQLGDDVESGHEYDDTQEIFLVFWDVEQPAPRYGD